MFVCVFKGFWRAELDEIRCVLASTKPKLWFTFMCKSGLSESGSSDQPRYKPMSVKFFWTFALIDIDVPLPYWYGTDKEWYKLDSNLMRRLTIGWIWIKKNLLVPGIYICILMNWCWTMYTDELMLNYVEQFKWWIRCYGSWQVIVIDL